MTIILPGSLSLFIQTAAAKQLTVRQKTLENNHCTLSFGILVEEHNLGRRQTTVESTFQPLCLNNLNALSVRTPEIVNLMKKLFAPMQFLQVRTFVNGSIVRIIYLTF